MLNKSTYGRTLSLLRNLPLAILLICSTTMHVRAESALGYFTINGFILSAEGGGGGQLHANRSAQGSWERFTLLWGDQNPHFGQPTPLNSGDKVCIQTFNGNFVVAENGGGRQMNADRPACNSWETFTIILLGPTPAGLFPIGGVIPTGPNVEAVAVALRASNGDFVSADGGGGGSGFMNANRNALGDWERFVFNQKAVH